MLEMTMVKWWRFKDVNADYLRLSLTILLEACNIDPSDIAICNELNATLEMWYDWKKNKILEDTYFIIK